MEIIIKANNLYFSYDKQNNVLTNVSFVVYKNDYISLIGPNGGGKSTLLKIILGLLEPERGEIEVFGSHFKNIRDKIGYVPQYSKIDLAFPISVWEVVMSGFLGKKRLGSSYTKSEKEKAIKVLNDLKIFQFKDRPIGELSGGQRQKVMIARALVRDPKLLLLDEPTNSIDKESSQDLYGLLQELNNNMTIIVVSHDIGTISRYVKRVFYLNNQIICKDVPDIVNSKANENIKILYN